MLFKFLGGIRALLHRRQVEDDLEAELRTYLDEAIEAKRQSGLSRAESSRAARAEFGSLEAVKDRVREVGWESIVESIGRDVRYALRTLRRSPGFSTAAVSTLALGIGATAAIFTLLDAIALKPLPVSDPHELAAIRGSLHYPVFEAFRRREDIFADLLATSGVTELDVEVQNGARERTPVSLVSGSFFSTLGIGPAVGRVFTVRDDVTPGAHPVAVASHAYWQRRFGRDPAILGRVVRISGTPVTVIGVAPPGFFGEQVGLAPDLWIPLTMWGEIVPGRDLLRSPGTGWLRMVGRVRPGVKTSGPNAVLSETFRQVLAEIFGPGASTDDKRDIARAAISLEPAGRGWSNVRTRFELPLRLLMGAVALVLLIACANVASLLLARGAARRRELDVRLALGVSRSRLLRQLLTESLVLAGLGGAAGIVVAWLGAGALLRLLSAGESPLPLPTAPDARLLAFVTLVTLATVVLSGLVPAWQASRSPAGITRGARGPAAAAPLQRIRSVLVVVQVAMSLVLLTGAGLFLRTIANLRSVDLGFVPEHLLVVDVTPHGPGYAGERAVVQTRRLLDVLRATPGVSSVSFSESGVLTARNFSTNLMRPAGFAAGREGFPRTQFDWVGPQYFHTIGATLVAGRDFSERDDAASPRLIAINEAMAKQFFPEGQPLGRHLLWDVTGGQKSFEVVAVVRDVKQRSPKDRSELRAYLPYLQMPAVRPTWVPASTRFLIRTTAPLQAVVPILRERILSDDRRVSISSVDTGLGLLSRTVAQERAIATLLVVFGLLAVVLASVGLYGLIAYSVVQRTAEIGVRLALGAQRSEVLWMMLRGALIWIGVGVTIGIPISLGVSRVARGLLFGLSPHDTGALAAATVVMCVLGLIAAVVPAKRAMRIDPVIALRQE